ncbi:MAG: argininosuccinate lyase [Actinobacteria bacterium]|nr:argininosuccinate lyase [Actinomycetota bacterium]MCL5886799.1 argininosuccinate lyase [Actinomycetota bacterium]
MNRPRKNWGGRFERFGGRFLEEFGASLDVDKRMWAEDIRASIAHARMLADNEVISIADADAIEEGLSQIYREIRDGSFVFDLADEDIHMAIERILTERIGPAGGRLHTARSRNDQVATDTRLYVKRCAVELIEANVSLREAILQLAKDQAHVVMPGYTHLQKAQPVLFSHHVLAYLWMFSRDALRLRHAHDAADTLPLGSAALAGTSFPIDRQQVADRLGFAGISANSMDAVSDRDFLLDIVYACAVSMIHMSRLCEELILWSTEEFGFVTMDDTYATGSSIMPQKKNPDFAELVRGKSGRVTGDLMGLFMVLKGLPLAYNKDMQEDKESAFDAIDTTLACMNVVSGMLSTLRVNEERMAQAALGGFMAATDLADHLVVQGLPFRAAHEIVGRLVLECERSGRTLQDLSAEEYAAIHPGFGEGVLDVIDIHSVVARRISAGGTGVEPVAAQLVAAEQDIAKDRGWIQSAAPKV